MVFQKNSWQQVSNLQVRENLQRISKGANKLVFQGETKCLLENANVSPLKDVLNKPGSAAGISPTVFRSGNISNTQDEPFTFMVSDV